MREIPFTKPGFQRQSSNDVSRIYQTLRVMSAMEAAFPITLANSEEMISLLDAGGR